jgi:glycosyltransferase involved in cell wall biosynthesis
VRLLFVADANSIHTNRWVAPLVERGDEIHVLSYLSVRREIPGVKTIDLTQMVNIRKLRFAYWGLWTHQYARRFRPDVLHVQQLHGPGWIGAMACYHPFVATAWGSDLLVEPHGPALRRSLLNIVLAKCNRVTVPSQLLYDSARQLGVPAAKLRLIPWGLDTGVFSPQPDDRAATRQSLGLAVDSKVVLCPRAVARLYNQDVLLGAVKAVIAEVPGVVLLLLRYNTNEAYLRELVELVSTLGLEEHVVWLPAQETPSDMARLYRMSDVMVSIPSSEGYGATVYESMASGCPAIITDLPAFVGEVTDGVQALKVSVRDADQTASAIRRVIDSRALRDELRANGLALCRGKSTKVRAEQTSTLYRELLAR